MSELNLRMVITYVELQGICIFMLAWLLGGTIRHNILEQVRTSKKVIGVYVLYMIVLLSDSIRIVGEYFFPGKEIIVYITNDVWYLAGLWAPYLWLLYSEAESGSLHSKNKIFATIMAVPAAIISVLVCTTPWNHPVYSFDADGKIVSEDWYLVALIVMNLYLVIAAVLALIRAAKAPVRIERRLNLYLALFTVPCLSMDFVQYFTAYGLSCIGYTISLSIIYAFVITGRNREHIMLLNSLSEDYEGVFAVDVDRDRIRTIRALDDYSRRVVRHEGEISYSKRISNGIAINVVEDDRKRVEDSFDAENAYANLEGKTSFYINYRVKTLDGQEVYYQAKFVRAPWRDRRTFVLGIRNVDEGMREKIKRDDIIRILAEDYTGLYFLNIEAKTSEIVATNSRGMEETERRFVRSEDVTSAFATFVTSRVFPEDRPIIRDAMDYDVLRERLSHQKHYSIVFRRLYDGEYKYTEMVAAKAESVDEPPVMVAVGFAQVDREYREKMAKEKMLSDALKRADAANEAKSAFLFNMSHDIRTPMNAIIGFTDLARKHLNDTDKVDEYLDKISLSSQHLLELINEILDMSRVESGKISAEIKPVNLCKLADRLLTINNENAQKHEIELAVDTSGVKNCDVCADELHLNQILMNILSNGIKYTKPGGRVFMTVREVKNPAKDVGIYSFTVQDNGIGMSEEFVSHVFESFEREHNSTVSGIQGTGLGMSIVKRLVDFMGGNIEIHSALGRGTTVTVTVTLKILRKAERVEVEKPIEKINLEGKRVLVTEDNELNREIVDAILNEAGILTENAENGEAAVKLVESNDAGYYDCILMDIQMPVMNGYEATKKIRNMENGRKVPIIALSANAFDEAKQQSLEAGMNDHVTKPVNVKELLRAIERCVRND